MKKNLIIILILAFLIFIIPVYAKDLNISSVQTENSVSISNSQTQISVIDPTPSTNPAGAYYPGLRGGNQLIIYTPKYGSRTGTNEFGREAVVSNGTVINLTGGNSLIPQNGFVISGHGKAKNWINQNLIEGAVVKINTNLNTLESAITPESYIFRANQKIKDVKNLISEYKKSSKLYKAPEAKLYLNKAEKKVNEAKKYLEKQDLNKVQDITSLASSLADSALYYTIPSKSDELHGIWLRPTEKSRTEIQQTLDKLRETGIDNVFLETYYQGYTIFPSKTLESCRVISQRKEFQGWDPLKVWIEEAHSRNMKIHVWFQTYYAGTEDISKNTNHIISVHPDWANIQKRNALINKPMPSVSEHNAYFLDPANPEVQAYLMSLLSEIANNYDVDGLNIDYIRYPVSLPSNFPDYIDSTWGYTNYARNEFKTMYGTDPINITADNPLWQKWIFYRKNKVTELVSSLKSITKDKKITVSAVIFPDTEENSTVKLQDWKTWGNNCYVDAFTPLIMGSDELLAKNYIEQVKNSTNNKEAIYPGLFEPFTFATQSDLLHQIKSSREAGASGMVIFDYAHLNKDFQAALGSRVFKK